MKIPYHHHTLTIKISLPYLGMKALVVKVKQCYTTYEMLIDYLKHV